MQHHFNNYYLQITMYKSIALTLLAAAAVPTSASLRGAGTTYKKLDRIQNNAIQHPTTKQQRDLRHHRIIGGDEAVEDRYSYTVSLSDDWGHFCGGSLIAPNVVLSAAHCQGGRYQATVGRHGMNDNDGESINVMMEIPHPDYDEDTTDNDFMLLFLANNVTVDVKMVNINSDANVPALEQAVTVVGWGDTDITDGTEMPIFLQEVEVNAISNDDCNASDGPYGTYGEAGGITDNMLCAREEGGGEDSCQGDSGGPLVIKGADPNGADDVQIGVVSWGYGCAMAEYPGVYARVSSRYEWIRKTVCLNSQSDHGFNCDDIDETDLPEAAAVDNNDESTSTADSDVSTGNWDNVLREDFTYGYGSAFDHMGNDARHYAGTVEGKQGVVLIGGGNGGKSTFQSHQLSSSDGAYSFFKVTATVLATEMEQGDDICIDFTGNNEQSGQKCWRALQEFQNDEWITLTYHFDTVSVDQLQLSIKIDTVDEDNAGLLIDEITIDAE
jgi:trypsin